MRRFSRPTSSTYPSLRLLIQQRIFDVLDAAMKDRSTNGSPNSTPILFAAKERARIEPVMRLGWLVIVVDLPTRSATPMWDAPPGRSVGLVFDSESRTTLGRSTRLIIRLGESNRDYFPISCFIFFQGIVLATSAGSRQPRRACLMPNRMSSSPLVR